MVKCDFLVIHCRITKGCRRIGKYIALPSFSVPVFLLTVWVGMLAGWSARNNDEWDCIKPQLFSKPPELGLLSEWDNKTLYLTDIRKEFGQGQTWRYTLSISKNSGKTFLFPGLAENRRMESQPGLFINLDGRKV